MDTNRFSQEITVFHGRTAPEAGTLVGYGALIESLQLPVPLPDKLTLISQKHRRYETIEWRILTPRHQPQENLYNQLVFAIKYEGIHLLFFNKLFEQQSDEVITTWIKNEPLSQYARKIWFLYEWLTGKQLEIENLREGNYVNVLDEKLQFAAEEGIKLSRYRIKNNLPGTSDFCPLIYKTEKLEKYISADLPRETKTIINQVHKDILQRTSAFLLVKDSKASFTIEGENPTQTRATRWGRAIGQAGTKPLSREELLRLQQIVIENSRFVKMGYRKEGGFIGEHDRSDGEPLPDHISARWQDIEKLMEGLIRAATQMENAQYHPVLTAASIAFGFVFIHPFADGNGRIHRYLIHHLLASMKFTPPGIIFPVSAAILDRIDEYRKVLESYSHPLLDFIQWKKTADNNVEVINETIDYYRYFDATKQAEFLFDCVEFTIHKIIPQEVGYLKKYDAMKRWLDDQFQMPDKTISLLIRFLEQNNGVLSRRAREKEFTELTEEEVKEIERRYKLNFEL